jgi:hypothetical protein
MGQFRLRLHMFGRELIPERPNVLPQTQFVAEWFSLVIGQHHGLPTRLLDITRNPLAALYIALKRNNEPNPASGYHVVWCISYDDAKMKRFDNLLNSAPSGNEMMRSIPFRPASAVLANTTIFYPPTIDQRIFAQQALFIHFRHPSLALEDQTSFSYKREHTIQISEKAFLGKSDCEFKATPRSLSILRLQETDSLTVNNIDERHSDITVNGKHKFTIEKYAGRYYLLEDQDKSKATCLYKIRVKYDDATHKQLLKELNELAVNEETLFPDLDGVAKHLDTQIRNMNWL